jgi:hypothetical protein
MAMRGIPDARRVPDEEAEAESINQVEDIIDLEEDVGHVAAKRRRTDTAVPGARRCDQVIKVRRPYIIWITATWEERKKSEQGVGATDGPVGPDGPDGPACTVVPGSADAADVAGRRPTTFHEHVKAMAPQWKRVTCEQKLPWLTQSQEEFNVLHVQRKQTASGGLKRRKSEVQTPCETKDDLARQVASCSAFGGRGLMLGNFTVRHSAPSLGAGRSGRVFQAVHTVTGQRAALKIFGRSPSALNSMQREVEIYQTLQAVSSQSEDSTTSTFFFLRLMASSATPVRWICLEDGGLSLRVLMQTRRWSDDWMYPVANQLRMALQHMHRAGLVHLDVKPDNLVLDTARMCLRVIDMGMAEQWIGDNLPRLRYETYVSEWYRPPELFHNDRDKIDRSLLRYADWRPC